MIRDSRTTNAPKPGSTGFVTLTWPSLSAQRGRKCGNPEQERLDEAVRHAYDEVVGQAAVIRGSDLDWTLVRVPGLTNGPVTPSGPAALAPAQSAS